MLISIPTPLEVVETNVTDTREIYDSAQEYQDKDLVQYDPDGNDYLRIYGVFNEKDEADVGYHRFVYYSETAPNAVNDGKNYSKAVMTDEIYYELSVDGNFDTIALGKVLADTISLDFLDEEGVLVFEVSDLPIDNKIDELGVHPNEPVTIILYCPNYIKQGGRVRVVLKHLENDVSVGTIMSGLSVKAGFTHLVLTSKFKDFSPTEQDQWGNVLYLDGTKVNIHTGTVDLPVTNYDYMNRIMRAIGGKEVIINGYGVKHNTIPGNKEGVFHATNMIGRIKSFSLSTKMVDKRLGHLAQYKITVEEIV